MEIKTKKGYFDVMASRDTTYPGVDVEFISNDDDGEHMTRPRIVFEYTENKVLRVLIWDDPDNEDYTREIIF